MRRSAWVAAGLMAGTAPLSAMAQDGAAASGTPQADEPQEEAAAPGGAAADGEAEAEEIVVTGQALPGAVKSDIPPEIQLSPADVRAYGVATIADLITELAPQTNSGRGRGNDGPVILLAGRRISSFSEIRDIPTEAILRVDILPEEVALKFGYRADQRVVNIVLRPRFRALTTELEGRLPTAGGTFTGQGGFDVLKINRDGRINFDLQYNARSRLLESERDILPTDTTSLFAPGGNIAGIGGGEIDPALSALAGVPVTSAAVPASAADGAPSLGAFVPGANRPTSWNPSAYRTLIAPQKNLTLNGIYSRNLSSKVTATVNTRIEATQSRALLGAYTLSLLVPEDNPFSPFAQDVQLSRAFPEFRPLSRSNRSLTAHGGLSLNGDGLPFSSNWRWSVTGNYDNVTTRTLTTTGLQSAPLQARLDAGDPTLNPFGALPDALLQVRPSDVARSTSSIGSVDALLNGPLFKLPAGDVSTSLHFQGRTSDLDSRSFRNGLARSSDIGRDSGSIQANLDLPIASRRRAVLSAIGDVSLNGNIEVEQLSDFGTLVTTGYGLNWSPIAQVRFLASVTDEEGAPSANQLGDPILTTPNVRIYDFVRGQTVDVTTITGGNPGLTADSRHVLKLGLNVRPLSDTDLSFSADYVTSTTRNQISAFPASTAAIEAAFPDRFVRDADGRLVSIDTRAVNFERAERQQLRWGVNFSMPLSSALAKRLQAMRAQRQAEREAAQRQAEQNGTPLPPEATGRWQGRPGGGDGANAPRPQGGFFGGGGGRGPGGFGGGGRGGRGGGGAMGGRLQFSLYHTWHLKEQVRIREGLPVLDLLDGGATGNDGGQPRHEVEGQAGIAKDGLGARLIGQWQSGTRVFAGTLGSGDELNFAPLAKFNLRLFADLGQQLNLVRKHRWLRGTRVTFAVDNLLDTRQRVTDGTGAVPLSYQPDLLDPTGRVVRLSVRKLFF